ncbi:tRNA preQ1(34) S-adenosylmethionine ribosyltransferase-isomerase QueA [soil metagenome]
MLTSELDYELPENLIAQKPADPRDTSRLMVVDVTTGEISHHTFRDLPNFLTPDDAMVLNETKVLPARLAATRPGGGDVELLFLRDFGGTWEVLARPSKRLRPGMKLGAGGDELEVLDELGEGRWTIRGRDLMQTLSRKGRMPLPPYISATREAESAYQTVYARSPGSAAAPTAGLHFSERVLGEVEDEGVNLTKVTLHVGTGTFTPVRADNLQEHRMHAEFYSIPNETVRTVRSANRIVGVGTTVARTLETWAASGKVEGESELFIYPGYRWRTVDSLLTNFHLPRSTLLAMVMSFAGVDLVRRAYQVAVDERYRFYSLGDAMLLVGGGRSS